MIGLWSRDYGDVSSTIWNSSSISIGCMLLIKCDINRLKHTLLRVCFIPVETVFDNSSAAEFNCVMMEDYQLELLNRHYHLHHLVVEILLWQWAIIIASLVITLQCHPLIWFAMHMLNDSFGKNAMTKCFFVRSLASSLSPLLTDNSPDLFAEESLCWRWMG